MILLMKTVSPHWADTEFSQPLVWILSYKWILLAGVISVILVRKPRLKHLPKSNGCKQRNQRQRPALPDIPPENMYLHVSVCSAHSIDSSKTSVPDFCYFQYVLGIDKRRTWATNVWGYSTNINYFNFPYSFPVLKKSPQFILFSNLM